MRNKLVAAAIAGLVATPAVSQAAPQVDWFGVTQITAETTSEQPNGDGGSLAFGADRIRIGYKAHWDNGVHSKLQVDFNESNGSVNQVPNVIKDAVVGYKFNDYADIQVGMRKTPVGMDFNTSGKKLDITKRSMEKDLVLERSAGAFLYGEADNAGAGTLGYAVSVTDPATRSGAINQNASCPGGQPAQPGNANAAGTLGEDYAYAGRLSYDMGKMLHVEGYYGTSTTSCTASNAEDYQVYGFGAKTQPMPGLNVKGEWINGSNANHVDGRDRSVWYVHGGYEFMPMVEGVVRHYNSNFEASGGGEADLAETWVGANIFLNPEKHHEARIQLNVVIPSGDTDASDYPAGFAAGNFHRTSLTFDDNGDAQTTFLAQFQTAF
jgi:hypothetical protein